jgi:hypothetical protein
VISAESSISFLAQPSTVIDPTGDPVTASVPPDPKSNLSVFTVVRFSIGACAKVADANIVTDTTSNKKRNFCCFILVVDEAAEEYRMKMLTPINGAFNRFLQEELAADERDVAALVGNG